MIRTLLLCACFAAVAFAQDNPLTASVKAGYLQGKNVITRSAEKMPEEHFTFKPSDDVRNYGQMLGHIADAQYLFCAPILGEQAKSPSVEKGTTGKAALVEAVKAAFAYCDKAWDSMTDAKAAEAVKFFGRDNTKIGVMAFNNMHNYEHYGNLVTYMRIKGVVPPSSEPRPAPAKK